MENFESSFDRILNQTRNNIDRVNRKYNNSNINSTTTTATSELRSRSPSPVRRRNENNNYINQQSPKRYSYEEIKTNDNISQSTLSNILNRLHRLENTNGIDNEYSADVLKQLSSLDKAVLLMKKSIDEIKDEIKEVQHNNSSFNMTVGRQEGCIDALKQEVDLRRSTISKWDMWAKATESWRDDIDNQILGLTKQIKGCERRDNDHVEGLSERATKSDLESLRDRMNMFTQQAISASMAAWHDRMESSVKNVERQVAALWVTNDAVRNSGTNLMPSDESGDNKANSILMPSELLVKGAVASAVRELENSLEDKIESRVIANMKNEVSDSQKIMKGEMAEFVKKIAVDLGLVPDEGETISPAMKMTAVRKSTEKDIDNLSQKLDDLSCAIISLQETAESDEKNMRLELRGMERKVEESITIASSTLASVNARCAVVEESTRNAELRIGSSQSEIQLEFLNRLRDACDSWANDRGALDRRILITERISEDIVERMKLTGNIIDSYFQTSPVMKKLEASANQYEVMQVEVSCLKQESRDLATIVSRLDATAARKNDISEIRERVAPIDQLLDQLSQNIANTRTLGEDVSTLKFALAGVEATVVTMTAEQQSQSSKMVATESEINHQNSQLSVLTETQQKQGLTLKQVETQCKFEFGSNKENISLFNTRLVEVDSRLRSMEITTKAQFASSQAEIQHIQSKLSENNILQSRSKVEVPESLSSYNEKIASIVERVSNLENASPSPKKSYNMRAPSPSPVPRFEPEKSTIVEAIIPITPDQVTSHSKLASDKKSDDVSLFEDSSTFGSIMSESSIPSPSPRKADASNELTVDKDISILQTPSILKDENSENINISLSSTERSPEIIREQNKQRVRLDDFEELDIESIDATPKTLQKSKLTIDTSIDESTKKKLETIRKVEETLYEDSESDWDKESISSEVSSIASPQNGGLPPRARSPSISSYSPPQKPSRDSTPPRKPSRSNSPTIVQSEVANNTTTLRGPSPPRPPRAPSPSPVPRSEPEKNTKVEAIIPITPEQDITSEINTGASGLSVKERLKLRMENKKKGITEKESKVQDETETSTHDAPPLKPQRTRAQEN